MAPNQVPPVARFFLTGPPSENNWDQVRRVLRVVEAVLDRERGLRALSEFTSGLAEEHDPERLLERSLGTMIRLAGAQAGTVRVVTRLPSCL